MYKIYKDPITGIVTGIRRLPGNAIIPLDPANTDYQQFKLDITNGAELQDADGNVMTAEHVQEFLATLP